MTRLWKTAAALAAFTAFAGLGLFINQKRAQRGPTTIAARVQSGFLNLAPEVRYVGDEECAICHSEIFKSFKQTGMGRSFYSPAAAGLAADDVRNTHVYDAPSNFHYEVLLNEGALYQVEYRLDDGSRRVHELSRKADYVIGSGNHARTYLTAENGFLYEMPLTWYNQKKSWGMSPGYAVVNSRFSRPVIAGCMSCHNSYAEHTRYSGNHYTEVPHGIGCERCHGPGELHVAKRYQTKFADSTHKEIDRTIVNPRHLPAAMQMDVCYQCHLQGEVRILKEGKSENDFRPGMPLREVRSVYVLDHLPPGDFRVASHGERLARSACYLNSAGTLVCSTCHNPHQPVKSVARSSFNEKCLACHPHATLRPMQRGARHHARADCVACHMPQGQTADVVHVNFTDHWIQKKPLQSRTAEANETLTLKDFFEEEDPAAELRLGIAYLHYYDTANRERVYFERALALLERGVQNHPEHEAGLYHLGSAYFHAGRLEAAGQRFRVLTRIAPQNALGPLQLAQVLNKMGKREQAAEAYETAVRLFPQNAAALTQLGNLYVQLEKSSEARASYEKALAAQPSYAPAHNALGEFFARHRRETSKARPHFRNALRLDPDFIPALNNLGALAMASANYAEATQHFQRVLALDPEFVPAYGNLAFMYSVQGRYAEARSYLSRALQVDPQNSRLKSMLEQIEKPETAK